MEGIYQKDVSNPDEEGLDGVRDDGDHRVERHRRVMDLRGVGGVGKGDVGDAAGCGGVGRGERGAGVGGGGRDGADGRGGAGVPGAGGGGVERGPRNHDQRVPLDLPCSWTCVQRARSSQSRRGALEMYTRNLS